LDPAGKYIVADRPDIRSHLILPVGTQVVTRVAIPGHTGDPERPAGAVGMVIQAPSDNLHSYRIRFPDGTEAALRRHELAVRKHYQREGLDEAATAHADLDLYDTVIYRCVVGSTAYGLDEEGSDVDRRGIYLPPAERHWSLYGVPEQLENQEAEECYWELQKFLVLALKANPNVLECLYTPLVERAAPLAEELLTMRSIFLSRLVYQTYNGYVMSQFKKLEQDLRNRGELKWKHAMHLIRLLLSGVTVLKAGVVQVRVQEHREKLLAIRRGEMPWEEVNAWRLSLHREFDAALGVTRLPERPDYENANAFLIKARRSMV
jgi:predicted nucleotidyltransferase